MAIEYRFKRLAREDLPLIERWLAAPHVAKWWPSKDRQLDNIKRHIDEPNIELFVVHADARPIAYLQCYDAPAGGMPFPDQPAGSRGIDLFIGEVDMVARGHGPAFVRAFAEGLFQTGVPRVMADPDPANAYAVRAYQKAGFTPVRLVDTPHGRTLLMIRDAPTGLSTGDPLTCNSATT